MITLFVLFFNVYVLLKEAVSRSLSLRTPWTMIINLKRFNKSLIIIWKKMFKFSIFKMLRNKNLKKNEIDQALLLKRWSATLQRKFRQKSTKTIIKWQHFAFFAEIKVQPWSLYCTEQYKQVETRTNGNYFLFKKFIIFKFMYFLQR